MGIRQVRALGSASALVLGVVVAEGGCANDDDSACGLATLQLSIVATAVDDGTTIRAELDLAQGDRLGEVQYLKLCGEDRLSIHGEEPLRINKGERWIYSVTTEAVLASRALEVSLERKDETSVAFQIELAAPFDITAPTPDSDVPRSQDAWIRWAPPNPQGDMHIALGEEIGSGVCLTTSTEEANYKGLEGVTVQDVGEWLIPAGHISGGARDRCVAEYRLFRETTSAYPDALHPGGSITGQVIRTARFRSVP